MNGDPKSLIEKLKVVSHMLLVVAGCWVIISNFAVMTDVSDRLRSLEQNNIKLAEDLKERLAGDAATRIADRVAGELREKIVADLAVKVAAEVAAKLEASKKEPNR